MAMKFEKMLPRGSSTTGGASDIVLGKLIPVFANVSIVRKRLARVFEEVKYGLQPDFKPYIDNLTFLGYYIRVHLSRMNSYHSAPKPPLGVFVATTIVIFFLSLSAADSVGFIPDYLDGTASEAAPVSADAQTSGTLALNELPMLGLPGQSEVSVPSQGTVLPTHIQIPAIDLDLKIQNPDTRDIDVLDGLLKNGPARYVDSAMLGGAGNTIIFAHSSHLPIVHNPMYKAFNRVPELGAGDTITLEGEDGISYLYAVVSVTKADTADTTIDLSISQGTRLTLVTCDTLTGKSARFVLTADFVGTVGEE